ncbi:glycoside hydrolase family 3 N-terminal domain-containing protein [Brachybacterium sp. DNPG3]
MTSDVLPAPAAAPISPADARRLAWARRIVQEMTVTERIAQLHQNAAGVERLGIASFVTGTEGVHGVAWKGEATQFPQPPGMAATWDPELLGQAAAVVAQEVREMHAEDPESVSLTVWAPVVNTLRHPLWGRTEEAYTEDPLLNAELGAGYADGLRGDGESWATVPTLKHFLAYSNETDRASTSSDMAPRVLHEYELPGYVEPVARGLAGSVMLAYNLVNGRPAHLTELLDTQLRAHLADPDLLFVVSDAGAPSNLFRSQKVVGDATEAYAALLQAGVDSFTDHDRDSSETVGAVTDALEKGLIGIELVDRAVVRQLVARARTGEFDALIAADAAADASAADASDAADASAPSYRLDAPASRADRRALAREVATRSAVLLSRRDERALPLPTGPIALIGVQAHDVLRDWYSGDFCETTSILEGLTALRGQDVRFTSGNDIVELSVRRNGVVPGVAGEETLGSLSGGAPTVESPEPVRFAADASLRCDRPIANVPAVGEEPVRIEVVDRGEGVVELREISTGKLVTVDDRGQLVATATRVGGWVAQETFRREIVAEGVWRLQHAGSGRYVGLEHYNGALILRSALVASAAEFAVEVVRDGAAAVDEIVAGASAAVLVVGNDPHIHGRETEDRPHARLADADRAAAEHLASLPADVATVLVITSSYPYDLEGLEERIGAVVWSSHAGEAEGEALADLLTGARDFSGRLAQTWPTSAPLPSLLDYDVIRTGSTYLYGQDARFGFGHGLAYDRPDWMGASIALSAGSADEPALTARVTLSAPAERLVEGPLREVVQVYADVPASSFSRRAYTVPATRLIGFRAIEVPADPADTAEVTIEVPLARLALFAPDLDAWELPDGPVTIRLARSSGDTVSSQELTLPASAPRGAAPATAAGTASDRERAALAAIAPAGSAASGSAASGAATSGSGAAEASSGAVLVPAARAEEIVGLARAAASLLDGTELRAFAPSVGGTADLVLPAGAVVVGLETASGDADGATLVDATGPSAPAGSSAAAVPSDLHAAPALALPHTVLADEGRATGRVRIRLTGRTALRGLLVELP